MTNFLLEPETDPQIIGWRLKHQIKESRKFKQTEPYHTERKCEDRTKCVFHHRKAHQ